MSQRVTVNHSRIATALFRTIQLAGLIALTSCARQQPAATQPAATPQPAASATAPASKAPASGSWSGAAHAILSGGSGPADSQPYGGPAANATVAGAPPQNNAASPQATVQPPPPPPSVVGRTLSDVRRALGDPSDEHASGGAQTWIYRHEGCSLELTSFYDVSSGDYVVLSQQASPADATDGCTKRNGG